MRLHIFFFSSYSKPEFGGVLQKKHFSLEINPYSEKRPFGHDIIKWAPYQPFSAISALSNTYQWFGLCVLISMHLF